MQSDDPEVQNAINETKKFYHTRWKYKDVFRSCLTLAVRNDAPTALVTMASLDLVIYHNPALAESRGVSIRALEDEDWQKFVENPVGYWRKKYDDFDTLDTETLEDDLAEPLISVDIHSFWGRLWLGARWVVWAPFSLLFGLCLSSAKMD